VARFIHAVENYAKLTGKTVSYIVDMDVTVPLKTIRILILFLALAKSI
jgi:hypothetical protein